MRAVDRVGLPARVSRVPPLTAPAMEVLQDGFRADERSSDASMDAERAKIARRATAWSIAFALLAAVHLALLPPLLDESFDVAMARIAGIAYVCLSVANWRWRSSMLAWRRSQSSRMAATPPARACAVATSAASRTAPSATAPTAAK
jgi:hypothetical protein